MMGSDFYWWCGDNAYVFGHGSERYIDFTSGIFACNCGHGNKRVGEWVGNQLPDMHRYSYVSGLGMSHVTYSQRGVRQ